MRRTFALIALTSALGPLASFTLAQPPPAPPPTVITLRPAAEPRPALKYRLVPEQRSLEPGNAAIFYHRAIQFVLEMRAHQPAVEGKPATAPGKRPESIDERISRWGTVPIEEFPRDEARKGIEPFQKVLHEVELATKRSTCDWEFDLRKEGINLLLPEIQEMRSLARIVKVQARLAILEGKTDEAMHWIQIGLVMGRHVSQGPTLIQALVGVAIDSVMTSCLVDLIQTPGTPSLVWALVDRPQPFIDLRPALEGERYLLERELPELDELDRGAWSLDEARQFTRGLEQKLVILTPIGGTSPTDPGAPINLPSATRRLGIAAMAAKVYPTAKKALIAEGRPEAEVEAMPVVQVASLYSFQEYSRLRDAYYKWMNVPYWQSFDRAYQANFSGLEEKLANPLLTLFRLLAPSLNAARLAALRIDRQFNAIACIESIRIYMHAHSGKLPASLDEITEAPVPRDPATGQPFVYRVHGDTATLTAPIPPGGPNHPAYLIDYLLKPAR